MLRKPAEPIEVLQCATALTRKWQNERAGARADGTPRASGHDAHPGLEAANRQLRHLATHDALTGLPNRVLLDDRLPQAIAHADRDKRSFALLVCDLDRFKLVNDSLGHRAGDELLQEVARRLTRVVRNFGYGGTLRRRRIRPDRHLDRRRRGCGGLAARVMDVLQAPVRIDGIDVHTSPSIGIAFYPDDGSTIEALIAHADAAMYSAKQRGRGNVQCFAPGMDAGTEDRVQLESDLHNAIALEAFELYYQPKVDTHRRGPQRRGADPLDAPEARHRFTGRFIPLAEECGLIGAIGDWVVREACRQARAWQIEGVPPLRISVNLSASQFRGSGLIDTIRRALDDAGLEPRYLEVELTESAVMSDPEESVAILEHLSDMGVLVSVDDFGTGYSSMSYLRRFPIDKLKIDRIFINEIASRPEDASIVRAIVSLAHSLRLKVVAEGVETPAQLDFLKTAGCDEYQGYHFSRPLPAAEFERLIRESQEQDVLTEDDAARTHSKLSVHVGKRGS